MKLTLDCKVFDNKCALLKEFQKTFDEMYGLSYDALIDGARCYARELTVCIENADCYEDEQNLRETLDIITRENPLIKILYKSTSCPQ